MSKISLKHSGGNVVSLNSPTSAPTSADVAFKLPNQDGSASEALITDGSGNLSFASVAGGKILQVKTNTTRDSTGSVHCNPTKTYVDITDQNVTITPSATTSKIKISFHQFGETGSSAHQYFFAVKRAISGGATTILQAPAAGNRGTGMTTPFINWPAQDNENTPGVAQMSNYLDSPNTTSAITYTVVVQHFESTNYYYYNRTVQDNDDSARERGLSWITVEEVAA